MSNGNQIYDRGRNKKNVGSFLDLFYDVKKEKNIDDENEDYFEEYIAHQKKQLDLYDFEEKEITAFYSFFSLFIPTRNYFITPLIINFNILIFILMCFSGVKHLFSRNK